MKISPRHHLLFWIGYIIWDLIQIRMSFNSTTYPDMNMDFIHYACSAAVDFISKFFLYYMLFFFTVRPLFLNKKNYALPLILGVVFTVMALLLQRSLNFYFLFPMVFEWNMSGRKFFNVSALVVTLFDILVPVCLLLIIELYRYTKMAKERVTQLEKEKLKSELSFLKAQINPHFLFNVLSTVHALSRHKAPEAANVVIKLSEIMRFMLFEVKNRTITLAEEQKFLEDFIELEKIRFQQKLSVDFISDIDNPNEMIAPMILLPFVENAFKHGAAESRFHSFVHIYIKVKNKNLIFNVENSVELSSPKDYHSGIGLNNVRRQLELLYPGHELKIEERPESFFISLRLNLNVYEETNLPDHRG